MSKSDSRRSIRWDIENARNNYLALIFAQGGLAAASFGCVWIITHTLGPEPYGNVAAFIAASQLAQVSLWWTVNALTRFGVQEFIESGKISNSFWSRTIVLLANMVVVFGSYPLWMPVLANAFKLSEDILFITALYLAVTAIWMHLQFAMQASKLPVRLAIGQMSERIVTLMIVATFAFTGGLTWQSAVSAYVISPCLLIIYGIYNLRHLVNWRFWLIKIDVSRIKEILLFSIPIPLYSLLSPLALNYVGSIFILHYLTKADLGVYTVAFQLYGLIMVLPTLAGSLMVPLFVSSKSDENGGSLIASFLEDVLPTITVLFSMGSSVLVVVLYYLLPFIFGSGFADVGNILWIMMSAGVIASPIMIGLFPFSLSGNSNYQQLIPAFFSTTVLVAVSFVLVPKYGLIGSAWSTLISFFVMLIIFSLLVHRRERLGFPKTLIVATVSLLGALAHSFGFHILICAIIVIVLLLLIITVDRHTYLRAFTRIKAVLTAKQLSI